MHISQYSKTDKTLVVGNLILMFKIFPTLDFGHACADLTLLSPHHDGFYIFINSLKDLPTPRFLFIYLLFYFLWIIVQS